MSDGEEIIRQIQSGGGEEAYFLPKLISTVQVHRQQVDGETERWWRVFGRGSRTTCGRRAGGETRGP